MPGFRPTRPHRWATRAAGAAAACSLVLGWSTTAPAAGPTTTAAPRCLGAASRDPLVPCDNPALRTRVAPLPEQALLTTDAPCTPVREAGFVDACAFGAPAARATRTVALLGDSHAAHWRATLAVIARRRGWRVISLTRYSCPFSTAATRNADAADCQSWNRGVLRWLEGHPAVRDVFVSAFAGAQVVTTPGRSQLAAKVDGYRRAWASLPAAVRHVIVLRDNAAQPPQTADCVTRAAARGIDAGRSCTVPRYELGTDAAVYAARRLPASRVAVVDVSAVLCGPRVCYPVIGGVLVDRDTNHFTQAFAATLARFVLRVTDRAIGRAGSQEA